MVESDVRVGCERVLVVIEGLPRLLGSLEGTFSRVVLECSLQWNGFCQVSSIFL